MSLTPAWMHVIDSHTGGKPTRVIVSGGPELDGGTLAEHHARFQRDIDHYRSAEVSEPRSGDPFVGALLYEPVAPDCVADVIFFNNVGYLGMCGHGTIGVVTTLAYLGCIALGVHRLETPMGVVHATLEDRGFVAV